MDKADGIIATDRGGDFELPAAGSYIARCYQLVDIGTQHEMFQGKPTKPTRKVIMWFELLEDEEGTPYRMSNGEPFSIMQKYTLSTNSKANLRKHIDAWRGKPLTDAEAKGFNLVKLLGQACRLQVILNESGDRTYVNIASIGYTKKNPEGVNPTTWWTITDPDTEAYGNFPDWLRQKIATADEWDIVQNKPVEDVKPTDEDVENLDLDNLGVKF